jgi:hypothetical protein
MGLIGYTVAACSPTECFVHYGLRQSWAPIRLPLFYGKNNIIRRKERDIIIQMAVDDDTVEKNDKDSDGTGRYNPPKHSEAFLRHLESVKLSWPYNDNTAADVADHKIDNNSEYSVYCTGEPSIDPSRMLQSISDDDYDWI